MAGKDKAVIIVESILGNIHNEPWRTRLQSARIDALALDQWEAQKNRFRKKAASGTPIAVSLDRGVFMRDGDVLQWDETTRLAVVANITLREVMVVRLEGLSSQAPEAVVRICVELGHALGNQHWPAIVKGDQVFVPLTVDRKVMASVMKTHAFHGIAYEFIPGSEVIPFLAPHESRRLFGGAEGPVHSHVNDAVSDPDPDTAHAHRHGDVVHTHVRNTIGHVHGHDHPHEHEHRD